MVGSTIHRSLMVIAKIPVCMNKIVKILGINFSINLEYRYFSVLFFHLSTTVKHGLPLFTVKTEKSVICGHEVKGQHQVFSLKIIVSLMSSLNKLIYLPLDIPLH